MPWSPPDAPQPPTTLRALLAALILLVTMLTATPARAATPGSATTVTGTGNTYTVTTSTAARMRLVLVRTDILRIWVAPDGQFTDPAGTDITVRTGFGAVASSLTDAGTHYRVATSAMVVRINKNPLTVEAYRPDGRPLWREAQPLDWTDGRTTQRLRRAADEQFYGTGLRLGEWALRDKTVPIAVDNQWRENTNASPAPFYLSTNGYGVLRNTWAPGSYGFTDPVTTVHDEQRFDAYYFVGNSLKGVLGAYTDVTGKPFLSPLWGFELGNADCFNASSPTYQGDHNRAGHQRTPDVLAYARQARAADMPSGWFMPNDGYGCGHTDLPATVAGAEALGFKTGLWTSTGLAGIDEEVGVAGTRGVKTDVAWVGGGYRNAFHGVQQAVDGIEHNSDARRYVWTVDGWAGTQRNAVVWTGDTYGTWNDMRWTVPAVAGAGLSGFNYATGDVDGIFGGSPQTYVRDLQWKSFTPAFMTMSGWGATNPAPGYQDKQPWRFSEPYLSINRKYLHLKMRLMPYHYTMSHTASTTGVPATRALVLEYPHDPVARGNATSAQFMAGDAFLVAPVTTSTEIRDGIYLPAGTWTDYWTGTVHQGPVTLNGHAAPLDRLPLFVKGGSIVPMWPQMNYTGEKPVSSLTYDLYPRGSTAFTLYEDDGITRAHRTGAYATQRVTMTAPAAGTGTVTVNVGASTGNYAGKPASRAYEFTVHLAAAPTSVAVAGRPVTGLATRAAYDAASSGWFHAGGVLHIKAGSRTSAFTTRIGGAVLPAATGSGTTAPPIPRDTWRLVHADSEETTAENAGATRAFDGDPATTWHTAWSAAPAPLPHEIQLDLGATHRIETLRYLPRQDGGVNGRIGAYEIYVSDTPDDWGPAAATGTFADTATEQSVRFTGAPTGRYLRLRALSEAGNRGPWTSVAELTLTGTRGG
ncbi:TIM-barrel domain-containing protein [Actinoplanes sp. DH11]|uniref:TIM-barrel domain-containing protein n=1 Tax=Actinoplanes sp. DH11 TaxID=2857011 RepID=UPI001E2F6F48|nr:TIM-barrel domain-containing protein [Actinoplanes sp. DH11]